MKTANWVRRIAVTVLTWMLTICPLPGAERKSGGQPVLLVIMDPLAKELACACVKGYGQRDYRKLAARLEKELNQRISIEFSDDLVDTLELVRTSPAQEVMVIGDRSLVAHGASKAGLKSHPICELTDPEGNTAITASFVIRSDDPAKELKEIKGRKLLVGLAEADEKYAASLAALRSAGVEPPAKAEKHMLYSDAALDLLDSESSPLPVAVLPSYALRLLTGCGTVKPGTLKVIGTTPPAPFITVFVSDNTGTEKEEKIRKTLLGVERDALLLQALESKTGFKPVQAGVEPRGRPRTSADAQWPDWRGPNRDGRVPRLPSRLTSSPNVVWKKAGMNGALAGLSIGGGRLILAERDFGDENDVYRCLDAETGEFQWRAEFPARGNLDYGQFPRASPVIDGGRAYLLGAMGDLRCVDLTDGKVIWHRQLPREFKARLPTWGMCSPPLIVEDMLIVNPGGANASLVALDCANGRTRWSAPGYPAAYGAFIYGEFGAAPQIIGYDERSLGGWDARTGKRLWTVVPPTKGDFNVPTPIAANGGIVVSTENNGTRFYRFEKTGMIVATPAARFAELSPDTSTPVVTNGRVFGATRERLYCLDLQQGLRPIWDRKENTMGDHATLIADEERVLVITLGGELILLDARADKEPILDRMQLFQEDVEVYSHPALVGTRLYARGGSSVMCVELGTN